MNKKVNKIWIGRNENEEVITATALQAAHLSSTASDIPMSKRKRHR